MKQNVAREKTGRFDWLDTMKGLAILWIVVFHFCGMNKMFQSYPWILGLSYIEKLFAGCAAMAPGEKIIYLLRGAFVATVELGFHGVGIFLIASGFGLSYSMAKSGGDFHGWWSWYGKRFVRLYPLYWVAHLLFLISPFILRAEPIDYRFAVSLTGVRVYPLDMMFYYANPAWWFFTLLIQLYLVFPVLHFLHRKLGAAGFLLLSAGATFGVRYLLLCVTPVHGYVVQGAFFVCRLLEFAVGMALGQLARQNPAAMNARVFHLSTLGAGLLMYALGVLSYRTLWSYTFTDALTGIGLFIILAHVCRALERCAASWASGLAFIGTYSYGLYLFHQPYVLYFGKRMEAWSLSAFLAVGALVIAVLAGFSILIERAVNAGIKRRRQPKEQLPAPA